MVLIHAPPQVLLGSSLVSRLIVFPRFCRRPCLTVSRHTNVIVELEAVIDGGIGNAASGSEPICELTVSW